LNKRPKAIPIRNLVSVYFHSQNLRHPQTDETD
jgi:hypothetical protein